MTKTEQDLADEIISEIVSEEKAKLLGPECPAGQHDVRHNMKAEPQGMVEDPLYGTCETCERSLRRANPTAPWTVSHHGWCKCRDCQPRMDRTP